MIDNIMNKVSKHVYMCLSHNPCCQRNKLHNTYSSINTLKAAIFNKYKSSQYFKQVAYTKCFFANFLLINYNLK